MRISDWSSDVCSSDLILVDDMGFSDISSYGGEIPTPNLDRLAEGGLRFTQFYNTARCSCSRASLLTGTYPHQAGLGHLEAIRSEEHTSELQSLMRISYAVFCLKKKKLNKNTYQPP